MLAFRNSVVYYRQRIRNVNFLDSEARELPMRHKNWWMGRFGRQSKEESREKSEKRKEERKWWKERQDRQVVNGKEVRS